MAGDANELSIIMLTSNADTMRGLLFIV